MIEEENSDAKTEFVHVVVLDGGSCRRGKVNEDVALTLIGVASEDPADWEEMLAYWPRYTSRVVPEFLSHVALEIDEREKLHESILSSEDWIVLDLEQKRFLSGKAYPAIGTDACFSMHTDEGGKQKDPLSVHFAPWWELEEQVDFESIDSPRRSPIEKPAVDREFLFGSPMVQTIASQALKMMLDGRLKEAVKNCDAKVHDPFYDLTLELHRNWLMTPREDLGDSTPRQMLHGGIDWVEKLSWAQRLRFEDEPAQRQIVAIPKSSSGYKHGPMGLEEVAMYFDLCRELIEASWFWWQHNSEGTNEGKTISAEPDNSVETAAEEKLIGFLDEVKLNWLTSPFEGGSTPAFILECSRRRVPRGAGVEIIGMDQRQNAEHVIDCDCPICIMMAEGKMGIGFCSIDGHHLEIDGEFAFSLHETRESWEAEQREWEEFSAKSDREREERKQQADELEKDEFATAWSGNVSDEPIPGDSGGHMKLAFQLAEIVTELQQDSNGKPNGSDVVKQLNGDFASFRNSGSDELTANVTTLANTLEQIAEAHPNLLSRIADFQSRIAESARLSLLKQSSTIRDLPEDDIPY